MHNLVFPLPPQVPTDASEEEMRLATEALLRWQDAYLRWSSAMAYHNQWKRRLRRFFLLQRPYKLVNVRAFWGPEFTNGQVFTT